MNSQANTQQKEQCWRYHNIQLQNIIQSNSNKNSMVLAQKQIGRPVEQNRGPRYESSYAHLIFDQGAKNIQWRKDSLFYQCCLVKWLSICKKLTLDPCLSVCSNIKSKWIKDLNVRPETLKLVQEGAGNTLKAIDVLNRTPAALQLIERMDK
jgi:hypothetical protein